jgi:ribosomal protein L40E
MSSEPDHRTQAEAEMEEKQLCLSCLFPNTTSANFCAKCGAPLSSYAATGPFEHLFAEGYVYREAAEKPRSLIVVLGIWLIFGFMALTGAFMVFLVRSGVHYTALGAVMLVISLMLI